jgi:hypothetical protein
MNVTFSEKVKIEINNECSDNPSHVKHKTSEVPNERSDNPSHLRHKSSEVTNEYSDNPSHLKHKTGEVTNQPSTNNEKSQTALNQEEPENVTFISASVSGRKHYTKVNVCVLDMGSDRSFDARLSMLPEEYNNPCC